jgi:hypothetical protein
VVWATPCTLGIIYLLYHQAKILGQRRRLSGLRQAAAGLGPTRN